MTKPDISVIITTYNRANILPRAVESVFTQTYGNYDIHIVDDASSDNTRNAAESFMNRSNNIYYWRHEDRKGLAAARNTGIAHSLGRYIAFLDDDDQWKPDCLQKRIDLLASLTDIETEKLGVIYCGCEIHILHKNRIAFNLPKIHGNIRQNIIKNDIYTIPSSCLFSKSALQKVGGFDENLPSSIDHDIWMALASHEFNALAVNKPLVITYDKKNRKAMMTDTMPRIIGVERFLEKWTPVFHDWFGTAQAASYIKKYRRRVLMRLASDKIIGGNWKQASDLLLHVRSKNNRIAPEIGYLIRTIAVKLAKEYIPIRLLSFINAKKKNISWQL